MQAPCALFDLRAGREIFVNHEIAAWKLRIRLQQLTSSLLVFFHEMKSCSSTINKRSYHSACFVDLAVVDDSSGEEVLTVSLAFINEGVARHDAFCPATRYLE